MDAERLRLREEEEALFSQCIDVYDAMKGKGNKPRSSLTDERKQEASLTRKAEGMVGDVMCRFEGAPTLAVCGGFLVAASATPSGCRHQETATNRSTT